MKIVFIGSVEFSLKALDKLTSLNAQITGVCTKKLSTFNADFTDLMPFCSDNDIPCKYVDDINAPETLAWINACKPDVVFCFGWSSLIKTELLQLSPLGVIGYHPTLLPKNRGRHPLIWALVLGLQETGSSFFFMDEGADTGDIISQRPIAITTEDNAQTLYAKMTDTALKQIEKFVPQLENQTFSRVPQQHQLANNWRKRGPKDGLIDFRMTSQAIHNLVRALTRPYIGAHLVFKDKDIKVWKTRLIDNSQQNLEPGKVLAVKNNTIVVKTSDAALELTEHEFEQTPLVGDYL